MPEAREHGKAATLPVAEINPLHHPLLRKNLERWAEVYFGNPPEKRDEAVLQLLRELEGRGPGGNSSRATATTDAPTQAQPVVCEACGYVTRPNQRFCGRCGARLITPFADALEQGQRERAYAASASMSPSSEQEAGIFSMFPSAAQQESSSEASEVTPEDGTWDITEEPTIWRSYRLYVGIAFAALICYLGYLAWSSRQTPPSATLPQQAPANTANSSNPPRQSTDQPAQKEQGKQSDASSAPSTSPSGPAQPAQNAGADSNSAQAGANSANTSQTTNSAQGSATDAFADAEKLLNAPPGQRNSVEAAKLLWTSVSKKNTTAMVTLAELYLRGDGVQKNCDQGRVLLDAAAKKGSKEAAEILRNLPGFGCE